jgi:hypothetical protein
MVAFIVCANLLQLLEAIGAITEKDDNKSAACGSNYQDDVSGIEHDCDAYYIDDDAEQSVLGAIFKVCPTCLAVGLCMTILPSAAKNCSRSSLKSTKMTHLAQGRTCQSFTRLTGRQQHRADAYTRCED